MPEARLTALGSRLLYATSLVAVLLFWSTHLTNHKLANRYRQLIASSQPILLNGARLSLAGQAISGSPFSDRDSGKGRYLLLASSDVCAASLQIQPHWEALIRQTRFAAADRVLLLTFAGQRNFHNIVAVLRERQIQYNIMEVVDPAALSAISGIEATPLTIALDSDRRVRLIAVVLSPRTRDAVAAYFDHEAKAETSDSAKHF